MQVFMSIYWQSEKWMKDNLAVLKLIYKKKYGVVPFEIQNAINGNYIF